MFSCTWCDYWCPVQGQDLDALILMGPFQLSIFNGSMIIWGLVKSFVKSSVSDTPCFNPQHKRNHKILWEIDSEFLETEMFLELTNFLKSLGSSAKCRCLWPHLHEHTEPLTQNILKQINRNPHTVTTAQDESRKPVILI